MLEPLSPIDTEILKNKLIKEKSDEICSHMQEMLSKNFQIGKETKVYQNYANSDNFKDALYMSINKFKSLGWKIEQSNQYDERNKISYIVFYFSAKK